MANVLIACEESQRICAEFRKRGHNAYSCDIQECSGGHPEWHFKQDCLEVIKNHGGGLENGEQYFLPDGENWDLMIAHPPCTYLSVIGARWMNHPKYKDTRPQLQKEAIEFFMEFTKTDIKRWAIENPVGCMSKHYRKPDQIIQPYWFGDSASKRTCLWLHNLPLLTPTKMVDPGEQVVFKSGKKLQKWFSDAYKLPPKERSKVRSKTFPGIAEAIAEQWGKLL